MPNLNLAQILPGRLLFLRFVYYYPMLNTGRKDGCGHLVCSGLMVTLYRSRGQTNRIRFTDSAGNYRKPDLSASRLFNLRLVTIVMAAWWLRCWSSRSRLV